MISFYTPWRIESDHGMKWVNMLFVIMKSYGKKQLANIIIITLMLLLLISNRWEIFRRPSNVRAVLNAFTCDFSAVISFPNQEGPPVLIFLILSCFGIFGLDFFIVHWYFRKFWNSHDFYLFLFQITFKSVDELILVSASLLSWNFYFLISKKNLLSMKFVA